MSTPLHMLLKAVPSLEGDVADDKADPVVDRLAKFLHFIKFLSILVQRCMVVLCAVGLLLFLELVTNDWFYLCYRVATLPLCIVGWRRPRPGDLARPPSHHVARPI